MADMARKNVSMLATGSALVWLAEYLAERCLDEAIKIALGGIRALMFHL